MVEKKPEFVMRSPSWIRAARSGPGIGLKMAPDYRTERVFRDETPTNRLQAG